MFHVLKRDEQRKGSIADVAFEGAPYGAGLSFFHGNLSPGQGPGLHQHPYPETCIVLSGRVQVVVDGEQVEAAAGDILVMGPKTPHRFTAAGEGRLDMLCIHASDRFIMEWLDGR